jgi:GH24 family phage-related lysozyme (muramidase)
MRPIPPILIKFLERVEGERTKAYQDIRGIWTIGVGHTSADVHDGLVWTQDQIDQTLASDLGIAQKRLLWAVSQAAIDALTDNQYAALLSFVFNVGAGLSWGIWKCVRQGDLSRVPDELARFNMAGGKISQGLLNRRAAEIALWNGEDPLCVRYGPEVAPEPIVAVQGPPTETVAAPDLEIAAPPDNTLTTVKPITDNLMPEAIAACVALAVALAIWAWERIKKFKRRKSSDVKPVSTYILPVQENPQTKDTTNVESNHR